MPIIGTKTITVNTASGTATSVTSDWIPTNLLETPFNVGFGVVKSGGGEVTYRVEHTFDNIFDPDVTPTSFIHADVTAETGNVDGNYAFGVRAIREAIVSASGSSSLTLTTIQAGF